jgi:FkbM family methyltransferase
MSTTGWNFEKEYEVITHIIKENPVIIDIGAHKGESIKNFLKFKPNAIIYAFEPNPKLSTVLKQKYACNNAVKIFNLAVSTKSSLRLYIP